MKLFVATVPNSECDNFTAEVCFAMSVAFKCGMKQMPEERDANYYYIDFDDASQSMAEATKNRIIAGPNGMGKFLSDIGRSVYGLYRADIIHDDITLDEYIKKKEA
jgi:hypothetical protein